MGFLLDEKLIAKYPFLSQSKNFLGGGFGSLDVREAVAFAKECFAREEHLPENAAREAKNLLLARLMLYSLGAGFLRKFAFFKSREYSRMLAGEEEGVLMAIARDFFPSVEKTPEGSFGVSLLDYLQYGKNLPQAGVSSGKVFFDKSELAECLRTAIETRVSDFSKLDSRLPESLKRASLELKDSIPREFSPKPKGKYLQRPELQKILRGESEGKRYYGAMAVAIACVKDGLGKEEALEVMHDYVENCAKGSHPFSHREGESVIEWVYRHPGIGFSFSVLKTQGLAD